MSPESPSIPSLDLVNFNPVFWLNQWLNEEVCSRESCKLFGDCLTYNLIVPDYYEEVPGATK